MEGGETTSGQANRLPHLRTKFFGTVRHARGNIDVTRMDSGCKVLDVPVMLPLNSEHELAERLRQGDCEAFTSLYRTYSPAIFRFAFHMTGDRNRATEVTQDVFVWIIRHPRAFDPERGSFAAFLSGVARQFIRRQQRTERRWLPFSEATVSQSGDFADPGNAIDADALRKAVALLPIRYREAVVLHDLEGHSYEEVSKLLNCAVGTVRSRLHRARELLAHKFQRRTKR